MGRTEIKVHPWLLVVGSHSHISLQRVQTAGGESREALYPATSKRALMGAMTAKQRVPPSAVESRDHGLGHEANIGTPVAAPRTMTADQGEAVIQPVWPVLGAPTP